MAQAVLVLATMAQTDRIKFYGLTTSRATQLAQVAAVVAAVEDHTARVEAATARTVAAVVAASFLVKAAKQLSLSHTP
jgi:hypothetical protein